MCVMSPEITKTGHSNVLSMICEFRVVVTMSHTQRNWTTDPFLCVLCVYNYLAVLFQHW